MLSNSLENVHVSLFLYAFNTSCTRACPMYLRPQLICRWLKSSLCFTYEPKNLFLNQTILTILAYFTFNKCIKLTQAMGSPTLEGKEAMWKGHV